MTAAGPPAPPSPTEKPAAAWVALLVVAAVAAAYQPVWQAGFIWDDPEHLVNNPMVHSLSGVLGMWLNPRPQGGGIQVYPVTMTSFYLQYLVHGAEPTAYHVANILLHALSAVLLWRLLLLLGIPAPLWAALVFALHPVQVESVAWVSERKNVLCMVFYLASLHSLVRFFGLNQLLVPAPPPSTHPMRLYVWGALFFALALLSKTVAATLPAALLLLLLLKRRGAASAREAAWLLPLLAMGAYLGLSTAWVEEHQVGATGAAFAMPILERFLLASRALCFYAWKLLAPVGLCFNYVRWNVTRSDPAFWASAACVVAACGILLHQRRRLGPGPVVAACCYAGTLFPALGFFNVYPFRFSYVADHFQYLATPWFLTLCTVAVHGLGQVLHARAVPTRTLRAGAALAVASLGCLTWLQAHDYQDAATLWMATLQTNPRSQLAHINLATLRAREGDLEDAEHLLREARSLDPADPVAADNLARLYLRMGRPQVALEEAQAAMRLDPALPNYQLTQAVALLQLGQRTDALEVLQRVVAADPGLEEARLLLEQLRAGGGQPAP